MNEQTNNGQGPALIRKIHTHAFVIDLHSPVIPMKAVKGVGPALHIKKPRKIKMDLILPASAGMMSP